MDCQFHIGDIVEIADKIDPENQPTTIATIKYIEQDTDIPDLYWLYLVANEEVLNAHIDKCGYYWEIVPDSYDYMRLLSRAVV